MIHDKAIDAAERQAHRINNETSGRMCHCSECEQEHPEPEMGQPIWSIKWADRPDGPAGPSVLELIQIGTQPGGTFRAESSDGAEISLHVDQNGALVLVVEDDTMPPNSQQLIYVLRRPNGN